MSTSVSDQRMKGQGNQANGPKDHVTEHEDFDSWRNQPHQGYSAPSMGSDPYMPSYYGNTFPYQFGVGDGTWSNSGDPMTFLGSYGGQMGHDSYGIDGMFGAGAGSFSGFGQPNPSFGYGFQGNGGDYSTWGGGGGGSGASVNSSAAGPATNNGGRNKNTASYEDYYSHHRGGPAGNDGYGSRASDDHHLKAVEQGMTGLGIDGGRGDGHSGGNAGSGEKHEGKMGGLGGHMETNQGSHHVNHGSSAPSSQPKKLTWASVASQPAKPQLTIKKKSSVPPPMVPNRAPPSLDIGLWESKNGGVGMNVGPSVPPPPPPSGLGPGGPIGGVNMNKNMAPPQQSRPALYQGVRPPMRGGPQQMVPQGGPLPPTAFPPPPTQPSMPPAPPPQMTTPPMLPLASGTGPAVASTSPLAPHHPVLDELHSKHEYNPKEFDLTAKNARFFVIKSYSEDDIHRSIKYEVWCSTEHGNKRLDAAYRERESKGPVYLFFSVNGSGHFCGMAEMVSAVDMGATLSVWAQDKWRGQFGVKWIYVKDVPNSALRHIRLENNENKPVTNSRDTQEVLPEKGRQVLRIIHTYRHATSIFDDFIHYEKRQEEEHQRKVQPPSNHSERGGNGGGSERGGASERGDRGERNDRGDRGERGDRVDRGDREPRGRPPYDYRDNHQRDRDGYRGDRDGPHRGNEGRGPPRGDMYRGEGRDMRDRDRDRERDHHDGMNREGPGGGRGRGGRGGRN